MLHCPTQRCLMNIFLSSKKTTKVMCSLNKYSKDNNTLEAETMCGYNGAATGLTGPLRMQSDEETMKGGM